MRTRRARVSELSSSGRKVEIMTTVAVVGLGYVGLPAVCLFVDAGLSVVEESGDDW